jgi:hypothetical protein
LSSALRYSSATRNGYLEVPEVDAAEAFRHFSSVRERAAFHIQPNIVAEAGGFNHQSVSVPMANRIPVPPRLRIVVWQRTSIHENLPYTGLRFVQNHDQSRHLDDLSGLWMGVQLH